MPRTQDKPKLDKGTEFAFYSRHSHLRLVRVAGFSAPNAWGQLVTQERFPGVTRRVYEFKNGHLPVVVGGENWDVFPDGPDGEEQDTLQWLRSHEEFNVRFHEHGNEPDRPLPLEEDFMDWVNDASVNLDVDRITELLRTERESHNRANLVTVADRARKRTLETRRQLEAQQRDLPDEAA